MAVRSMPGVRLRSTSEDAATAVQESSVVRRRTHSAPSAARAAAVPRSPPGARQILGDVQTVTTEAACADVQAWCVEIERRCHRAAPNSNRSSQRRRIGRDSILLPDAHSGRVHRSCPALRLHEAHHSHLWVRRTPLVPQAWAWSYPATRRFGAHERK